MVDGVDGKNEEAPDYQQVEQAHKRFAQDFALEEDIEGGIDDAREYWLETIIRFGLAQPQQPHQRDGSRGKIVDRAYQDKAKQKLSQEG